MIDTIREGTAPPIIRRKGAAGELHVTLEENIEILTYLAQDSDETTRALAFATLQAWNPAELQQILSKPGTPSAILDFAATYLAHERRDLAEALLQNNQLAQDLRIIVKDLMPGFATEPTAAAGVGQITPASPAGPPDETPIAANSALPASSESPGTSESPGEEKAVVKKRTLLEKISGMTPSQKIKSALTGNMEERMVLIRDSNKLVARAVLGSPKLTDQEIENIASMKNVTEEVLRLISMNRKFMRTYGVVRQLINNPRTPIDVGMSLLHRVNERDLKGLLMNKNIAEVVRSMAVKMIKTKEEANKPKPLKK